MKIVIISEYNKFVSLGGTEYYVDMLINGLLLLGHRIVFITQGRSDKGTDMLSMDSAHHKYQTIFLSARKYSRMEVRQQIVSSTWEEIQPILEKELPDIIHVHTYSTFFNIRHLEVCTKFFKNIVFTSHIPGHFCPKGDLIKFNQTPCDGIIYSRCALCLFSKGIKTGVNNLIYQYHQKVLERLRSISRLGITLIGVSEWQRQNFISNGFDSSKVSVIRQAIYGKKDQNLSIERSSKVFTLGYLGRLAEEKGSVFLLMVIERLIATSAFKFVLGIPRANSNKDDLERLEKLVLRSEGKLTIMNDINLSNKASFFNEIDCLFIPSFCKETGPIVLLEAVQFCKQVLGPNIGGPLEFCNEFPSHVTTYLWNNQEDAVKEIKWLSKNKKVLPDYNPLLKKMEDSFIKKHLEIYNRLQSK